MRLRRIIQVGAVVLVAAVLHLAVASERGGYDAHYSDHLRHMASARALLAHGFDVYTTPYAEVTKGLQPCPAHAGLFDDRTAPYPPLGLLVHAPLAALEARGVLAPRHRASPADALEPPRWPRRLRPRVGAPEGLARRRRTGPGAAADAGGRGRQWLL
ncbi:MAG: hypothetical protein AMXMBFR34_07120 [Myxococcaceae bacterium]